MNKKILIVSSIAILGLLFSGEFALAQRGESDAQRVDPIKVRAINVDSSLVQSDRSNLVDSPRPGDRVAPVRSLTDVARLKARGSNFSDLRTIVNTWGNCLGSTFSGTSECIGDLNKDRVVDETDLNTLLEAWADAEVRADLQFKLRNCVTLSDLDLQVICLKKASQDSEVETKTLQASARLDARINARAENEDSREALKTRIEKRVENMLRHFNNMFGRMSAAIERLDRLAQRIESRISKFEEEGRNLDKSKELLVEARLKIDSSRKMLAEVSSSLNVTGLVGTGTEGSLAEVREMIDNLTESIKESHKALVEVIVSIKAVSN